MMPERVLDEWQKRKQEQIIHPYLKRKDSVGNGSLYAGNVFGKDIYVETLMHIRHFVEIEVIFCLY